MFWIITYHTNPNRSSPWAIYEYDNRYTPTETEKVFSAYIENHVAYMTVVNNESHEVAMTKGKKLIEATFC